MFGLEEKIFDTGDYGEASWSNEHRQHGSCLSPQGRIVYRAIRYRRNLIEKLFENGVK